jgi:hypothetical protein
MRRLISALAMTMLAACGGSDGGSGQGTTGGAIQGACSFSSGWTECDEWSGYATIDTAKTSCTAVSGTWSTSACSTSNVAGSCKTSTGGGSSFTQHYYTGISASLLSSIQTNCARAGTWTTGS